MCVSEICINDDDGGGNLQQLLQYPTKTLLIEL